MRRVCKILAWGFLLAVAGVGLCQWAVVASAEGRLYADAKSVPADGRVALVLGCSKTVPGRGANRFFGKRMAAAAELYHAGKCPALIVSGDNSVKGYDEPGDMKAALMEAGVPESKIYCDYAGFRTLDSVVRARAIFGQSRVTIVSQRFHNQRAIFLARNLGLDAIGLNARDAVLSRPKQWSNSLRELLARVAAVLDAKVLHTQPKFLGPPVPVVLSARG